MFFSFLFLNASVQLWILYIMLEYINPHATYFYRKISIRTNKYDSSIPEHKMKIKIILNIKIFNRIIIED